MRVSMPIGFCVRGFSAPRKGLCSGRAVSLVIIWLGLVGASQGRRKKNPTAVGQRWDEESGRGRVSVSFTTALANRADGPNDGHRARARVRSCCDGEKKVHGTKQVIAALFAGVNKEFPRQ